MLEGKFIIIPALGHQNKSKSSFTGSGLFVLMSQCENNNELALQHGWFCTTWSLAAKGLLSDRTLRTPLYTASPSVRLHHRHTNAKFREACGEGFLTRKRMATRVWWSINSLEIQGRKSIQNKKKFFLSDDIVIVIGSSAFTRLNLYITLPNGRGQ